MKKALLFLFALSAVVASQAQVLSSEGIPKSFSGKVSSFDADSKPILSLKSDTFQDTPRRAQPKVAKSPLSSNSRVGKFYVAANFTSLSSVLVDDLDKEVAATGVTVGFDTDVKLYKDLVYMTFGVDMAYNTVAYGNSNNYLVFNASLLDFTIPINVGVNLKLGDRYAIRPYVGVGATISALGNYTDVNGSTSIFQYKGFNRTRFGAQYGVGFAIKRFYVGVEGRSQFSEIYTATKLNTAMILLGVTF